LIWTIGIGAGSIIGVAVSILVLQLLVSENADTVARHTLVEDTDNGGVCYSPGCLTMSRTFQRALNPLVDPCIDFEEHVCGRYEGGDHDPIKSKFLRVFIAAVTSAGNMKVPHMGQNAAQKAAGMFQTCMSVLDGINSQLRILRDFMSESKLTLIEPAVSLTTAEAVFDLHVKLAFVYRLSGLISIDPEEPHFLSLTIDESIEIWKKFIGSTDSRRVLQFYAQHLLLYGLSLTQLYETYGRVIEHHTVIERAVATVASSASARTVTEVKVKDLELAPIPQGAFERAVTQNTRYTREDYVRIAQVALDLLTVVWRSLEPTKIVVWTSWHVLLECGRFVDTRLALAGDVRHYALQCAYTVSGVMDSAFEALAISPEITPNFRKSVGDVTSNIAACLRQNASRWFHKISPHTHVLVGFPYGLNSSWGLDARYAAYPESTGSFFATWVQAARIRSSQTSPDDFHFRALDTTVRCSRDSSIVAVPALLLSPPLFAVDGPAAINYGGLGDLIA
ncbi:unnamed protein product, partial [Ixodes hexagonus]